MAKNRKHAMGFKLQVINENLKGFSINSLSRKWDISTSVIRKWIDHHRSNGEKGLSGSIYLLHKGIKWTVIRAYKDNGLSLCDCCQHFNIRDQSSISSWIAKYEQQGLDGLNEQKKGRPPTMKRDNPIFKEAKPLTRLEELERENLYLKAEIDFLKKLDALTLLKQTQQRKKR